MTHQTGQSRDFAPLRASWLMVETMWELFCRFSPFLALIPSLDLTVDARYLEKNRHDVSNYGLH